jgi:hypothetical protein
MYSSQQTRNQSLSGYLPTVNTWSNSVPLTQNGTIERASEDFQAIALRDILASFRTEITNVLPSLSNEPASK